MLLDEMNIRTLSGEDIRGNSFEKYSKLYAKKKGVSRSAVDMTLTSKMLGSSKAKSTESGVKIELTGRVNKLKSFNHNTGDTLPKREFFGLNSKSVSDILKKIDLPEKEKITVKDVNKAIGELNASEG